MARARISYVCQSCGSVRAQWAGRCDACDAWNSLVEEGAAPVPGGLGADGGKKTRGKTNEVVLTGLSGGVAEEPRRRTGIEEFDRAVGGGLVAGSAVLVGGDPGIGKSTLLLQASAALAAGTSGTPGTRCVFISGEEAVAQVQMRARRLGVDQAPVMLAAETDLRRVLALLNGPEPLGLVVIDSIQTLYADSLESAPGTVSQLRVCAQELIRLAKRRGFAVVLVGHVTKEGMIAGPRVLEHMVDTVVYFEGDRGHQFRILRAVKNRYGPTDEIGVFAMTDAGLAPVENPSDLFLANRKGQVAGAAVFAGMEGSRPVLVEIQALVAASPMATPRRAVVGWDTGRLAMVLAVLETRCGLAFSGREVYLNVAGGLRISEPAADLAVATALVSSLTNMPTDDDLVVFGEIGLSGEARPVDRTDARLKEARKLGFRRALMPRRPGDGDSRQNLCIDHVSELVGLFPVEAAPASAKELR